MTDETQSKSELKRMAVMNPRQLYEENEKLQRQVNAMRTLLDAANEELNKRKWLPIETRPKGDETYLVTNEIKQVAPVVRGIVQNNPGTIWDWNYFYEAIAWMPMPDALKK